MLGVLVVTFDNDEDEWREEYDEFEDDRTEALPCPSCGAEVYEETQRCPHCGDWIVPHAAHARRKRGLWIVAAVLALIAIVVLALR